MAQAYVDFIRKKRNTKKTIFDIHHHEITKKFQRINIHTKQPSNTKDTKDNTNQPKPSTSSPCPKCGINKTAEHSPYTCALQLHQQQIRNVTKRNKVKHPIRASQAAIKLYLQKIPNKDHPKTTGNHQ